ncbi:hypothetical protein MMC19_006276 [Neofusicoccum parvum]|uniref:Uncharacterized protein n=1 Tax=Neofusicoccum parvum TaxID=310453 RepID=A0ACB5RQF9_9PEZI|nr:hypothetical protein MMC19_006276 [Neofusicoccum parvum]
MSALPPDPNERATSACNHLKATPPASMRLRLLDLHAHLPHGAIADPDSASTSLRRSVGRLTALATVLVPFTLAAAVFPMSGDLAAGESRFWVFWAVAIPLAC